MSVRAALTRRLVMALRDQGNNVTDISRLCGVSRRTVYDWLQKEQGAQDRHLIRLLHLAQIPITDVERRLLS
jgi:transposase